MNRSVLAHCVVWLLPAAVSGQERLHLFLDDAPVSALRLATLRDSGAAPAILWRGSTPRKETAGGWLIVAPVTLRSEFNSGYATDRNNGSLWGGRGLNGQLSAGIQLRAGPFVAAIRPEVNFHQNREFETRTAAASRHPLANPFYSGIDLPQRFGAESFTSIAPGQSFVRADFGPAALGISTENLWWGPGLRESIVLSNTAEGFPHAFVEATRPVDIGIGLLGGSAFWGRLSESEYFDTNSSNDHRLFTGAGLTFQPRGASNVTLGLTRLFTYAWDDLSFEQFMPFFAPVLKEDLSTPENPQGNNADDQRLSVFVHYKLPDPGFEVYGEFGREDHSWDFEDLVGEPEHSAAYLIGFQRLAELSGDRSLRVQGEWVNLQNLRAGSPSRTPGTHYVHSPSGHTQRGQMLGAGIGPGAESQFLGVDVIYPGSALGGFVERVRRSETSAPARASRQGWPLLHDVELTGGVRGSRRIQMIDVSGQLSYSHRLQRDFIEDVSNVRLVVQAGWQPSF